jgi:signal transduction histidine kinase
MLSATREGLIRLSPDGWITYINPDGENILGYPPSTMINQHYSRFFPPAPGVTSTLSDIFQPPPELPPAKQLTILDANNRPLTLVITASWIEPSEAPNKPQAHLLVFRQADEAQASNRLRSEFLANLAHEFRTPLSSITATIELLAEESSSMTQDEVSELANTALLGTHHLQTLIDNVLESAVIEADCFRLRCSPVLLRDVLHNAIHIMSPLLKRRKQSLNVEEPKYFLTILADPDRLCQAIVNLLDNASKYSPFGSTIELSFISQGQMLVFSISDSGPGIPPDRQDDLFKRFASLTNLQGAHLGIGLGLLVVKAIIEAHGGQVGAENRPEGGARFWFTLPLETSPDERGQSDKSPNCG